MIAIYQHARNTVRNNLLCINGPNCIESLLLAVVNGIVFRIECIDLF